MIDDRLDVHRAIRRIVPYRYLFGRQRGDIPLSVIYTPDWTSVAAHIIG